MFNLTGFEKHGDYLKVEDNYILFLSDTGTFRVNGQDTVSYSYGTRQIMLSEPPEVFSVSSARKELLHYKDSDGNIHTKVEVHSVYNKWQDEEGNYCYPDLDTEFEHRKELEVVRGYESVYKEHPAVLTPVETRCIGDVVDTGSRYIENALAYGAAGFSNGNLCKVNLSGIVADELILFVNDHNLNDKYENSSHSNVHYAKIGGQYVMTNIPEASEKKYWFSKTLEDARNKESELRRSVRNHLNTAVLGKDIALDGKSIASMYSDIERWIENVNKLDVKQKSNMSKVNLIASLRKTKETLSTLIK